MTPIFGENVKQQELLHSSSGIIHYTHLQPTLEGSSATPEVEDVYPS